MSSLTILPDSFFSFPQTPFERRKAFSVGRTSFGSPFPYFFAFPANCFNPPVLVSFFRHIISSLAPPFFFRYALNFRLPELALRSFLFLWFAATDMDLTHFPVSPVFDFVSPVPPKSPFVSFFPSRPWLLLAFPGLILPFFLSLMSFFFPPNKARVFLPPRSPPR